LIKAWRQQQLERFALDPELAEAALDHYKNNKTGAIDFINDWCTTYDPRMISQGKTAKMPFIMFTRQDEFVQFILACINKEADGLVEKSRDMGATWACCAISIWLWLFKDGSAIGWGSRKQELVDRIGDPSSIFEKMRMILRLFPPFLLPKGFTFDGNAHFMRITNPANGSSIIGEIGDQIGRGGRTLCYFKDESAHYDKAESIEAALMDNTRCQIDISSVGDTTTIFYRKRDTGIEWAPGDQIQNGKTNVFVMDWSHHPEKTKEWYQQRKAKAKSDGLSHVFAREVDRDSAASVEGVIISPDHVKAALDAHLRLGFDDSGGWASGLDVGDEGQDENAQTIRKGSVVRFIDEWGDRDTGLTARRSVSNCKTIVPEEDFLEFEYDCIGVGAGVKAETNRLNEKGKIPKHWSISPWAAGGAVLNPLDRVVKDDVDKRSPKNRDFFQNIKAQAWWELARRFENTYKAIYEEGFVWTPDMLISLPSTLPAKLLQKLMKELSQPIFAKSGTLKMMVKKTPENSKSPNLGDSCMMAFWPAKKRDRMIASLGMVIVRNR